MIKCNKFNCKIIQNRHLFLIFPTQVNIFAPNPFYLFIYGIKKQYLDIFL